MSALAVCSFLSPRLLGESSLLLDASLDTLPQNIITSSATEAGLDI